MITAYDNTDKKRLLVIEDDKSLGEVLRYNFLSEGYEVKLVNNGKDGLDFCLNWGADIIILDLMLPIINGIEICRNIRKEGILTPVIMLTAKETEIDRVVGLEVGADDYVTKPFSTRELIARVSANLRRVEMINNFSGINNQEFISMGIINIDKLARRVSVNKNNVTAMGIKF